jgi:signal peptidase II
MCRQANKEVFMGLTKANFSAKNCAPFLLTAFILIADQGIKSFIAHTWEQNSFITDVFGKDLLWIIHVRNKAIAFSLGQNLPDTIRPILFVVLPVIVLLFLAWYYFKTDELSQLQRWTVAGIVGGGFGNLIDRMFRPDGVVDFISVKFYGLFGFDRWPTFNIADSSVVVCVIIFLISILIPVKQHKTAKAPALAVGKTDE